MFRTSRTIFRRYTKAFTEMYATSVAVVLYQTSIYYDNISLLLKR